MESSTVASGRRARSFSRLRFGALRPLFALAIALAALDASADTFTVTTTADSGSGSLRQAILDANALTIVGGGACSPHSIVFAIPGTELHTIRPLSPLPAFEIGIDLDAYSQPGSSQNSLDLGDNAVLRIELDGSLAGATSNGLTMGPAIPGTDVICGSSGSHIRGLVINRFGGAGIAAEGSVCSAGQVCIVGAILIQGNFIGTDASGLAPLGNGGAGIRFGVHTQSNIVGDQVLVDGGPTTPSREQRNLIAANGGDGIYLGSSDPLNAALDHRIRNNYIGTDATGAAALPNGRHGIFADAGATFFKIYDNIVAGHPGDGVRIADSQVGFVAVYTNAIGVGLGGVALGNGGDGVFVGGSSRGVGVGGRYPFAPFGEASIANNAGAGVYVEGASTVDANPGSIGNNGELGIDLAPRGVNPQDPVQPDAGPNELLNAPVITAVTFALPASVHVDGTFDSTPSSHFEIAFYSSRACDASGYGEGETALGFVGVDTDAAGHATFSHDLVLQPGGFLTALSRRFATTPADSTLVVSEFSNCERVGSELVFADGFDP
jgi:hypothetical protein